MLKKSLLISIIMNKWLLLFAIVIYSKYLIKKRKEKLSMLSYAKSATARSAEWIQKR